MERPREQALRYLEEYDKKTNSRLNIKHILKVFEIKPEEI
jgi:hypothetical protein